MSIKKFTTRGRFNNQKVVKDGIKFDSKSEAHYYDILKAMLKEGKIKSFERQVRYPLPNMDGLLKMSYIADFYVTGNSGMEYIVDVKGLLTPEMKVKMAYCQHYYGLKIHLVFTTGVHAFRTEFLK